MPNGKQRYTTIQFASTLLLIVCGLLGAKPVVAQGLRGPIAVATSPDGQWLLVACRDSRQLLSVSLPEGKVQRQLALPEAATGLVIDEAGQTAIVTCAGLRSSVLRIDVETGEVLSSMLAGHTAISPVCNTAVDRLYICNRFSNDVSEFELSTGHELTRIKVAREPIAAALTPDGRRLLVANHLPHRSADPQAEEHVNAVMTVIDTQTHQTEQVELFSGASSVRGICVSPCGRYALLTHLLSNFENVPFRVDMGWINVNVVSVVDLIEMRTISAIGLDELYQGSANPWGIACGAKDGSVWVAASGTHELNHLMLSDLVSDRARKTMSPLPGAWPVYPSLGETMWKRLSLTGKGPRAVAVQGDKVYVAEYFSDTVAVATFEDGVVRLLKTIPLGPAPSLTLEQRGEMLFEDATICYQQWQSCASCHPDGRSDGLNWDLMNDGVGNPKNSKSMVLAHQTPPAMIKGVRPTAEIAVRSGLTHILFATRPEEEAAAIDAYLRSLEPVTSPYLIDGQWSESARRGQRLFESDDVGCCHCHPAPLYTDQKTHRMGRTPSRYFDNLFDTPTLREAWRTAPYLHDGQFATIEAMLRDGRHGLEHFRPLSDQELKDLTEFVLSL